MVCLRPVGPCASSNRPYSIIRFDLDET